MKIKKVFTSLLLFSGLIFANFCFVRFIAAETTKSGKIYFFESDASGFNTKNFFYDNGEEVVVFDTQFSPEIARQSIDFIRSKTSHPITFVVITHPNPDKFNGISEFRKLGAKIIASKTTALNMNGVHEYKKYYFVQIAKMFTENTYPSLSTIDIDFDKHYNLQLKNGEQIQLKELSRPGVSTNQTVALIPLRSAAIVGDLVHVKTHAWLEGGIVSGKATPTIQGWISDLRELKEILRKKPETIVYGGRGPSARVKTAVNDQIAYLKKADRIITQYSKNLGSNRSELQGPKAGEHYLAIQRKFEKEFPDYKLGYMIQYGVYGLVNSKQ